MQCDLVQYGGGLAESRGRARLPKELNTTHKGNSGSDALSFETPIDAPSRGIGA